MADNFKYFQGKKYRLAGSGVNSSIDSITLQSFKIEYPDGTTTDAVMATHFGTIGYGVIEPGTIKKENISFTGITQNANGTATLTGVTRGLDFVAPYTANASAATSHGGNTIFIISNPAPFYNKFTAKDNEETINQVWTFSVTPTITNAPSNGTDAINKNYADGLVVDGAPDADIETKGNLEVAETAEIDSGAVAGSGDTTADLAVTPSKLALSIYNTRLPSADEKAALNGTGTPSAGNKFVTADSLNSSVQNSSLNYGSSAVGSDAYAINPTPAIAAYTAGQVFHVKADVANTGAATLNVSGLGAKDIKKYVNADLATGDIVAGQVFTVVYDGTNFQMVVPLGSGDYNMTTGTIGDLNLSGAGGTLTEAGFNNDTVVNHGLGKTPKRITISANMSAGSSTEYTYGYAVYNSSSNDPILRNFTVLEGNDTAITRETGAGVFYCYGAGAANKAFLEIKVVSIGPTSFTFRVVGEAQTDGAGVASVTNISWTAE